MIRGGKTPTVDNCAAYRCMQYKTATSKAREWFLPNIEEAKLIIATQSKRLKADVVSEDGYWISSVKVDDSVREIVGTLYRGVLFHADRLGCTLCDYSRYSASVRAIRAF